VTRRALVIIATGGLGVLIVANVVTALSASNALPPTRADDDTVVAPPPESMLREACGDSNMTAPENEEDPLDASQSPQDGCPEEGSTPHPPGSCTGECTDTVPAPTPSDDPTQEPCPGSCDQPGTPAPDQSPTPVP
jgi:hypothetical protein